MSAVDLERTTRPFWLCRGCGHWSLSIEQPEPHSQNIPEDALPPGLEWLETGRGFRWASYRADAGDLYFHRLERVCDGDRPSRFYYERVCAHGYDRWTATKDP